MHFDRISLFFPVSCYPVHVHVPDQLSPSPAYARAMDVFPKLDSTAYPHVYDCILSHAPYELLIRLRLVNRASRAAADAALFDHVAFTRNNGPSNDTPNPTDRSASSIIARSLSASYTNNGRPNPARLPVPPLPCAAYDIYSLPTNRGWSHTRTIDYETSVKVRDGHGRTLNLPALDMVRQRVWTGGSLHAHTYVDVLRLPNRYDKSDVFINPLPRGARKHVIVALYDPEWKGLADRYNEIDIPFWSATQHCVIVFRACPATLTGTSRLHGKIEEGKVGECDGMDGKWPDEAQRVLERDEGQEARRGSEGAQGVSDDVAAQPRQLVPTFLEWFLGLVAGRTHASYTLVGLENVPASILALQLGLTADELALAPKPRGMAECECECESSDHAWARVVQDRTIEAVKALPSDADEWLSDDESPRVIEEEIEVLTMAEYRARVGEDIWARETFGGKLPVPLLQPM